jgi:type III pantothenate kinase
MKQSTPYLLMDISNSWTKWCPSTLRAIGKRSLLPTPSLDASALRKLLTHFPAACLVVSSVVPARTALVRQVWPKDRLHVVTHRSPLGIGILYPKPHRIGPDRLVNAVAASHLYPCPCVVIDFGTAVTFDIVSANKEYLGGVIAPGLDSMRDYLHERTALLPRIELKEPRRMIAQSTVEAMRVGAVVGYRGLVQSIHLAIQNELKAKRLSVIATGGHAPLISNKMAPRPKFDRDLTLQGLRLIAQNLKRQP